MEQITLTFSEAINNIKKYVNERKNEIKKKNERDYQEIESSLLYDLDWLKFLISITNYTISIIQNLNSII